MIKALIALALTITSYVGFENATEGGAVNSVTRQSLAQAKGDSIDSQLESAIDEYYLITLPYLMAINPMSEFNGKQIPTFGWMMKIAKCETGINWKNGGNYSGAFGIFTGTWKRWGGLEFAPTADQATPQEQMTVWIRIHVIGYQPIFKSFVPSAGWNINTCWHYAGDVQWITYDILQ